MADVAITAGIDANLYLKELHGGIFWRSISVGYIIFVDDDNNLCYRKTSDSGQSWGNKVLIKEGTIINCDAWADWQTPEDTGTKIHIAYTDVDTNDIRYIYLDTSIDNVMGDVQIEACQGSGVFYIAATGRFSYYLLSITKTKGGNVAITLKHKDDTFTSFYNFYISPDGITWTEKTSPWEDAPEDLMLLSPGNEIDTQDIWAIFWDGSADVISLKVFDDSENSWSETAFVSGMEVHQMYIQMDGSIRHSDGHLIFAAWNKLDDAAADLKIWDINGEGSITAKTNVITNTAEYAQCSVFINQTNDDIYVAYLGGTTWLSAVGCNYKLSEDGGTNWGDEVAFDVDAEDGHRWLSAGCMKASLGGRFMPIWFNYDLSILLTNYDNSIEIAAEAPEGFPYSQAIIIA